MAVVEDQFPVGMRVLAVDDDPICLKVLENLLRKCQYHVTTTNQAVTALKMLRENRSKYDLVISDVNMPDMDGFKLLELVGLEIDLPVIMLSSHSDKDLVYKGVTHGAVDYLLKPVRMEELKNIWQHVIRKKKLFPRDPTRSQNEGDDNDRNGEGLQGVASSGSSEQCGKANRKRKDQEEDEDEQDEDNEEDNEENGTQKKPRVVWSVDLHQKFVQAVDQLGLDKAVPKKILDLMNVEGLTRENVASHLQKYRLYLKKLSNQSAQSANMAAAFGAKDPCFLRPDGFGDFRSLVNPGRFSGSSISSYPPGGMLGRMNTSSGLSFRGMASSSLFQPSQSESQSQSHSQSQSQSLSNPSFGKLQPGLLPATQVTNLFQGVPTSLDSNQFQRKSAANFGEFSCNNNVTGFPIGNNFPDSNVAVSGLGNTVSSMPSNAMMFQLKQQNGQSGGQFPTQSPLNMPSLNQNSFGVGFNGSSSFVDHSTSNQSWHGPRGAAQLSSFPSNSLLLRDSFSHNPLSAGNNTGINFSSPGALPAHLDNSRVNMQGQASLIGNVVHNMNHTSSQRWEEHNQDYNPRANSTFINMDSLLSGNGAGPSTVDPRKKFDSSVVGQLNNGTSSVLQHSAEDTNMMSGDEGLLQQSKSPDGYIQNNYDFDDLMNSMMKREQGEALLGDAEFTFDGYNLGPCM